MDAWISIDDAQIRASLMQLIALGRDASPVMSTISDALRNGTIQRFRTETGPDGVKWKPSLRAQISGGRTLTRDGHLSGVFLSSRFGSHFAEVGNNAKYAAIHQFGGVIRAKAGGALRFRLANGAYAIVKKVTIPARPFMGFSDDDKTDVLDIIRKSILGAAHAG